jgi:chorismate synthase
MATFGESHGPALGVVVDGIPPGVELRRSFVQDELDRRRPGRSRLHSERSEPDRVEILSGVDGGTTLGTPVAMLIRNRDARSADYRGIRDLMRPGHADLTYRMRYGHGPLPGGGRASGRETAARVAAGALAKALLREAGTVVRAFVRRIGGAECPQPDSPDCADHPLRCPDPSAGRRMEAELERAMEDGDSLGGIVEVWADGVPGGLGDPVFDRLDALLAGAMMSIGGVKGVEVGEGFGLCGLRGSEANDPLGPDGPVTNRCGGLLGGISTGGRVVLRLAVKPTPSIAVRQRTVDTAGRPAEVSVKGRHDPCLCPRICPVAEAMAAAVLADALLVGEALGPAAAGPGGRGRRYPGGTYPGEVDGV